MIETGIILLIKQTEFFVEKQTKVSNFDVSLKIFYQLTGPFHEFVLQLKGQLISKELLGVFKSTKKTKIF